MTYSEIWAPVRPNLVAPRPDGFTPKLIIIHAMRGPLPSTQEVQFDATVGWFDNPSNMGGCASAAVGHLGQRARFMPDNMVPKWSAGYGPQIPPKGWAADHWGLSIENAQSSHLEPYTDDNIESAAELAAGWCRLHNIEPVHLPFQTQLGAGPTRSGFIGHDETANGKRLGKSDPGPLWPWDDYIARVRRYLAPAQEEGMDIRHNAVSDWFDQPENQAFAEPREVNGALDFGLPDDGTYALAIEVYLQPGSAPLNVHDGKLTGSQPGPYAGKVGWGGELHDTVWVNLDFGKFSLVPEAGGTVKLQRLGCVARRKR